MVLKKHIIIASLLFSTPVFAGPYIGVGAGMNYGSVSAPTTNTPAHPVSDTSTKHEKKDFGMKFAVGYRWQAWYTEAGYIDLGELLHEVTQSGENGSARSATRSEREEKADAIELKLGRLFALSQAVSLYAEAGAHRYRNAIKTGETRFETQLPSLTTTITSSSSTATEKKTAAVYGLGFLVNTGSPLTIKLGASRYSGIDRTNISASVQVGF